MLELLAESPAIFIAVAFAFALLVGSFLNVWHKDTDGSWKIMFDIWNSDRGQPFLPTEQK